MPKLFDIALSSYLKGTRAADYDKTIPQNYPRDCENFINFIYGDQSQFREDESYLDKEFDFILANAAIKIGIKIAPLKIAEIAPYLLEKVASNISEDSLQVLEYFIKNSQNPALFFEYLFPAEYFGTFDNNKEHNIAVSGLFSNCIRNSGQDFLPQENCHSVIKNFLFENYYSKCHQLNQEAAKIMMVDLCCNRLFDAAYNIYNYSPEAMNFYDNFIAHNDERPEHKRALDGFKKFVDEKLQWIFDDLDDDDSLPLQDVDAEPLAKRSRTDRTI